jgi:hypothetical protein
VHLVGFITTIYHDARSSECQNAQTQSAVTEVSNSGIHSKQYCNILGLHQQSPAQMWKESARAIIHSHLMSDRAIYCGLTWPTALRCLLGAGALSYLRNIISR